MRIVILLFARSRGIIPLLLVALLPLFCCFTLGVESVAVPLRDWAIAPPWLMGAAAGASVTATALGRPPGDLELSAGRVLPLLRLGWFLTVSSASVVVPGAFYGWLLGWDALWLVLRNAAALLGVSAISAVALPRSVAWLPAPIVLIGSWQFGTDERGLPAQWAWLFQPPLTAWVLLGSLAVFVSGATLYTVLDGRRVDS